MYDLGVWKNSFFNNWTDSKCIYSVLLQTKIKLFYSCYGSGKGKIPCKSNQLIYLLQLFIFLLTKTCFVFVNNAGQGSCLAVFDRCQLNKGSWLRGDPL